MLIPVKNISTGTMSTLLYSMMQTSTFRLLNSASSRPYSWFGSSRGKGLRMGGTEGAAQLPAALKTIASTTNLKVCLKFKLTHISVCSCLREKLAMKCGLDFPLLGRARHEGSTPLYRCITNVVSRKPNMASGISNLVSKTSPGQTSWFSKAKNRHSGVAS